MVAGEVPHQAVAGAAGDLVPEVVPVAEGSTQAVDQFPTDGRGEQGVPTRQHWSRRRQRDRDGGGAGTWSVDTSLPSPLTVETSGMSGNWEILRVVREFGET